MAIWRRCVSIRSTTFSIASESPSLDRRPNLAESLLHFDVCDDVRPKARDAPGPVAATARRAHGDARRAEGTRSHVRRGAGAEPARPWRGCAGQYFRVRELGCDTGFLPPDAGGGCTAGGRRPHP
jgi:hypothetical protein